MEKEVKIILVSGVAITIKEEDEARINGSLDVKFRDIPAVIMGTVGNITISHKLSTGEYMEYYLTREKITWCYYSETKKDEEK